MALVRAVPGEHDLEIAQRLGVTAELCALKPQSQRVVFCFDDTGPQVCRMDVRAHAKILDDQGVVLFDQSPAVEVSALLPYAKPDDYDERRAWVAVLFELMAFTFDQVVKTYPDTRGLRPFALLPDDAENPQRSAGSAQAWKRHLEAFGDVQIARAVNAWLVYWGAQGTVDKLVNVRER